MYKAYVFDLDGTLIDSLKTIANAFNMQVEKQGYEPIEEKAFNYLVGDGPKILTERAVDLLIERDNLNLSEKEKNELVEIIYKEYMDYYLNMDDTFTKAFDGVRESLDDLKSRNKLIAVCTNKPLEATHIVLDNIFGRNYFDYIVGLEDGVKQKPDPEMMNKLMGELKINSEDIAYFGDTSTDMLTAKNLNIYAVGVTWGFRTKEELVKFGADKILEDPLKIMEV